MMTTEPTDNQSTENALEDPARKDIKKLNQIYSDSDACDKEAFAEYRTNIQLASGDHYNRAGSRYWNRLRESRTITPDQKIRLTKNHVGRICKLYQNSILSSNPGVTVSPKQEKEVQHQKSAEMHKSILEHIKEKHELARKKSLWCKDYVEIGEVVCKIFWDSQAGIQVGWEPETYPEGHPMEGMPATDAFTGQPIASQTPVMSGDLIFEIVHSFDLLRDPGVKSMNDSPYLIIRKMESVKDLLKRFGSDPEKARFIKESNDDTFRVFNNTVGVYTKSKGMTMVREYYYRKCADYPNGYYYLTTEGGILAEGELPFGIYPIEYLGFDELTTAPRARSIIRQLRPYQIEINRASSKMAEHQITIGDDKVFFQAGSKPSSGATTPGVRYANFTGSPPIVVPGRSGDQYLPYIESQIQEMYQIAELADINTEINGQLDPYTLLFRSMRQKQKFSFYSEKFDQFLVNVHKTALKIFKKYASPHLMIPVFGKNEQVNMQEFKNSPDTDWTIKVEPMSEDIETKFGKQITLNHILQYIGPQLDKRDIGKFLRLSPYMNTEKMFQDMTSDYDNLVNDILALDRGQYPPGNQYEDHLYMIKGLTTRMKQPDFQFLPHQVQQLYQKKMQEHQQIAAQQAAQIQRAESGFIPSGGYQVVCDLYVPDPKDPQKTKRVRVPSESLDWLLKNLEVQGSGQEQLAQLGNQQAQAQIAQMMPPRTAPASPQMPNQNRGPYGIN